MVAVELVQIFYTQLRPSLCFKNLPGSSAEDLYIVCYTEPGPLIIYLEEHEYVFMKQLGYIVI